MIYNNILILKNEKILLMFNRKTASLSILSLVINTLGYNKPDSDIFLRDKKLDDYSDYKKVVIVRNPFYRILSGYNDDLGYKIRVESGKNGWTIMYADHSS